MTAPSPQLARARRAFVWLGIVLPLVVTAVAVTIQIAVLPSVPDPIAIHWGPSGEADGFAAPWVVPVLSAILGIGLTALLAALGFLGAREGEWGPTLRFLGALTPAVVSGTLVLTTWSFVGQSGLATAADAPGILVALMSGIATATLVGGVAWALQPRIIASSGSTAGSQGTDIGPLTAGERVVWVRTATMATTGLVLVVALAVLLFGIAAVDAAVAGSAWPILVAVALVVTLAVLATALFRVRIDDEGLAVTSLLGVPRLRIPLSEVTQVRVVPVNPMADFGGWGLRTALDGRTGIVLRRGDGLEVARAGKEPFVVTVEDAATAAGVLNALRMRALGDGRI